MVLLNIKTTNGGKAKASRFKKKRATSGKSRTLATQKSRAVANIRSAGFVGMELKFVDTTRSQVAMATAWTSILPSAPVMNCISAPGIGTGESERDGRVFVIKSIHVRGTVSVVGVEASAAPIADDEWRICVVWDTQTNATAMAGTGVMDAGSTNDVNSFRNLQFSRRYIILYDSGYRRLPRPNTNEGAVNMFAANTVTVPWHMNKSFKDGIKVETVGTTAAVASISDNSISVIGVASQTGVLVSYESRCRFVG